MDPCTPQGAVEKALSAFLLLGPVWGICLFKLDGLGAPGSDGWAWQRGWPLGEENVAFLMSPVDVTCLEFSGTWPGDCWQVEWAEQRQEPGGRGSHGEHGVWEAGTSMLGLILEGNHSEGRKGSGVRNQQTLKRYRV